MHSLAARLAFICLAGAFLFLPLAAFSQDRSALYRESSTTWTEFHVVALPDGGATLSGCGFIVDTNSGEKLGACSDPFDLRGSNRTSALQLGDGPALRAVKRELRVGDGGTP